MKVAQLTMKDVKLMDFEIHKMRGFIGNMFEKYDLIHNHGPNGLIYRYPLIQFKTVDKSPIILAIGDDAIKIFGEIFMTLDHLDIEGKYIPINEKELSVTDCPFGIADSLIEYEFIHPWIALNKENYEKYQSLKTLKEKKELVRRTLIGNILSMSKGLEYTVPARIEAETTLNTTKVKLKGVDIIGFIGIFRTNFEIPDFFGIGKSVSRGFGTVKRINKEGK
ncbi:DNA repair protein [bacterium]|nr:DNA repair protein [bacterium]